MNKSSIAVLIALAAVVAVAVHAAPGEVSGSDYGASLSVTTEQTDNALKTQTSETTEQQTRYNGGVFALYNNDYISLNSAYSASETQYVKDSQESRATLQGKTDFVWGKPHNAFDLQVSHTLTKLPKSSSSLDLESETDEKQVLSIQPGFRARITDADNFFINVNATEVDYRFEDQKNSSRIGGTVGVAHGISAVDSLSLYVVQSDVEFEFSPQVDYQQTMGVLAFEARLRQLNYRIELGQTRTDSVRLGVNEDPYYAFHLNHKTGFNQVGFSLSQQVSDSSRGFNGDFETGDIMGGGSDVTADKIDQVLLRHAELRWSTQAICERCDAYASINQDRHQFQFLERDEDRIGAKLGFAYRLSRNATLGFSANKVKQEFSGTANETEFTLDQIILYYSYSFSSGINVRFFTTQNERTTEEANAGYKELRAGATAGYRF